jgi:hypothetical protein
MKTKSPFELLQYLETHDALPDRFTMIGIASAMLGQADYTKHRGLASVRTLIADAREMLRFIPSGADASATIAECERMAITHAGKPTGVCRLTYAAGMAMEMAAEKNTFFGAWYLANVARGVLDALTAEGEEPTHTARCLATIIENRVAMPPAIG